MTTVTPQQPPRPSLPEVMHLRCPDHDAPAAQAQLSRVDGRPVADVRYECGCEQRVTLRRGP